MDIYLVTLDAKWERIAETKGIGYHTDISRDESHALIFSMQARSDSNLYLVDIHSKTSTLLTPHQGPGNYRQSKFSPDGGTIYLATDQDRDLKYFAAIHLTGEGGKMPLVALKTRDDAELWTFNISHDGRKAALVWNVAGKCELDVIDLENGEHVLCPDIPGEIINNVIFSRCGGLLAITATGSNLPSSIWIVDMAAGELSQLVDSQHAGVDLGALIRPTLTTFTAHDGIALTGWLYVPINFIAPGPLVISFHGGPEAQEMPEFDITYQVLLMREIAVFAPNVRGSSGFGKTFANLDNGSLRKNAIKDIISCVDHVVNIGVADFLRVGIMGGSYGGYMVMAGLTQYPQSFAAGVNLYGIVNFETFFKFTEPWMASISKIKYGDPETDAALLRELSPIRHIKNVKAPTLVLHGRNDTNVPVMEAEQLVACLEAQSVPVKFVLFDDEGHGFRKKQNRIHATVEIVEWFEQYLLYQHDVTN